MCINPGSAGRGVPESTVRGLSVILVEYACNGNENSLNDCLSSSLATCSSHDVAAVRCQGTVIFESMC